MFISPGNQPEVWHAFLSLVSSKKCLYVTSSEVAYNSVIATILRGSIVGALSVGRILSPIANGRVQSRFVWLEALRLSFRYLGFSGKVLLRIRNFCLAVYGCYLVLMLRPRTVMVMGQSGCGRVVDIARRLGCDVVVVMPSLEWREISNILDRERREANLWSDCLYAPDYRIRWVEWQQRKEVARSNLVICASELSAASFEAYAKARCIDAKIVTIPLGIDFPSVVPQRVRISDTSDVVRVAFTGRITQNKGVGYLVDALRTLEGVAWELLLIGDASTRLAQRLAGDDRIILTGHKTHAQLLELYSAVDIFVFPTLYEGFGMSPLEAMRCGVATVASTASWVGRAATSGVEILAVEPGNVVQLGEAIARLCEDRVLRSALAENGSRLSEGLTWFRYESLVREQLEALSLVP